MEREENQMVNQSLLSSDRSAKIGFSEVLTTCDQAMISFVN
jgi:hypothetical protein